MFPAEAKKYQRRVENHIRQYRPKMYLEFKKTGYLKTYVEDLSEQITGWVNSQEPTEEQLRELAPGERQRAWTTAFMIAESDALREYLPRDEASEELIGPNGGYVDKIIEFPTED